MPRRLENHAPSRRVWRTSAVQICTARSVGERHGANFIHSSTPFEGLGACTFRVCLSLAVVWETERTEGSVFCHSSWGDGCQTCASSGTHLHSSVQMNIGSSAKPCPCKFLLPCIRHVQGTAGCRLSISVGVLLFV